MTKTILAPCIVADVSPIHVNIFLAGSIEMGKAELWQDRVSAVFSEIECVGRIFNPRRDDWDSSWIQHISNANFNQQVTWEQDHLSDSDIQFFHFDPATMSPITLMELGYVLAEQGIYQSYQEEIKPLIIVSCPDGFWRQGNVEIMLDRAGLPMFRSLEDAIQELKRRVWSKHKILANMRGFFPYDSGMESQTEKEWYDTSVRGTKIPKGYAPPPKEKKVKSK
jgi:hypothetical protein